MFSETFQPWWLATCGGGFTLAAMATDISQLDLAEPTPPAETLRLGGLAVTATLLGCSAGIASWLVGCLVQGWLKYMQQATDGRRVFEALRGQVARMRSTAMTQLDHEATIETTKSLQASRRQVLREMADPLADNAYRLTLVTLKTTMIGQKQDIVGKMYDEIMDQMNGIRRSGLTNEEELKLYRKLLGKLLVDQALNPKEVSGANER